MVMALLDTRTDLRLHLRLKVLIVDILCGWGDRVPDVEVLVVVVFRLRMMRLRR